MRFIPQTKVWGFLAWIHVKIKIDAFSVVDKTNKRIDFYNDLVLPSWCKLE